MQRSLIERLFYQCWTEMAFLPSGLSQVKRAYSVVGSQAVDLADDMYSAVSISCKEKN